ncbi:MULTISPECIES: glycoside hydrolase family 105 protein [unclassified Paenibacillus]|uniref:glycoside hydrolase family 88/105 protein n=1 Tax=unclassified Paenibacillus TaxID=185978 RepID=UPI000CFC59C2|nr:MULTISPECIES: glycoside hydrolase family 88 protein [unclassified Paenibacillus]PQZ98387.1 glycosyl hydrolase [Paenibacillus sp. MYb63]PRA42733.1 glycosyl hydrolase [Paenibacillus sp. MYb67]
MTTYFSEPQSMYYRFGEDQDQVLKVLAERYIGANAQADFVYRVFQKSGILQNEKGLYDLNLGKRFPDAPKDHISYAAALVWGDEDRNLDVLVRCYGPVRFYFNEQMVYRSTVMDEISPDATVKLSIDIKPGWNTIWLEMKNTPAGFGCQFGSDEGKVRILNVFAPFQERQGQAGWVFSQPNPATSKQPDLLGKEADYSLNWLPETGWSDEDKTKPAFERIFGNLAGKHAYAWTHLNNIDSTGNQVRLSGQSSGSLSIWISGKPVAQVKEPGSFEVDVTVPFGRSDLLVRSEYDDKAGPWHFNLNATVSGKPLSLEIPQRVHGANGESWLYVGPFESEVEPDLADLTRTDRVYQTGQRQTYWRLDRPDAWIRPYYENAMLSNKWTVGSVTNYGRWDYPLGVTVYGLLRTGRYLQRPDITRYAAEHVQACTQMYEYSLWDREQYGFPAVNQQLVMLKMLDNCGSFGSAMLESYSECHEPTFLPIAERIADFMLSRLERQEDGAFYRTCVGEYAENTMWADDLYMSTPFLVRYARVTGNSTALDEAARQFSLYRKYLFMPEFKIMSHVYDFKYGQATQIPWGRGNGWTLFSLTEVLEALPAEHPERPALIDFFNELCEGYAALQGESGLWHQVLNVPQTYEEASCTAMFAYGFARGVRFGWFKDPEVYVTAAERAWKGLICKAIDRQGNVHGVCSGSRYAFTAEYYDQDLRTVTNDNHGIGIMMLAGTEVAKMKKYLAEHRVSSPAVSHS